MDHPLLKFWGFDQYDGLGISRTDRESLTGYQTCPACGTQRDHKSCQNVKLHVGSGGDVWPDILSGMPIFHERVVDAMAGANLTGYIAHPAEIVEIDNEAVAVLPVPKYYVIEITGRVDIDPNELDEHGGGICPLCFARNPKPGPHRWQEKRLVPKLETWDGSDFVKIRNWYTLHSYCTKPFVDLAHKYQWTHFQFGSGLPGVGAMLEEEKSPEDRISYNDSAWYEKIVARVMERHPDLAGN